MEYTPSPPPLSDPSSMDVPSMLSILEGEGFDISRLRKCWGRSTVERAYKNFSAYRESQSQALVAHSPSKEMTKEMATANNNGSEKEEESAGGRYVFMYLLILGKLLTLFLDSQLRKRAAVDLPKAVYVMNASVWSMLTVLISFAFTVLQKKKTPITPPKRQKLPVSPPKRQKLPVYPPERQQLMLKLSQKKS
jgi:hypothetical protein